MLRFGYSKSRPPGGNQSRRARFFMQVLGKKQLPPPEAGWGWVGLGGGGGVAGFWLAGFWLRADG